MGIISRFATISSEDKARAVKILVEGSTRDFDFFFMLTLSVLMATFGLLAGSETVVIGSMLLAPLLYPVLGVALGVSMSDPLLVSRSLGTVVRSMLVAIGTAMFATWLFAFGFADGNVNAVIASRIQPNLLFLLVGVISGLAVSYALVRPKLSETLPGVAVSVALLPPLAVVGIGIAWFDLAIVSGALMMFIVNVIGIMAAGMTSFSLMNVHGEQKIAQKTIVKEEQRVQKEIAQVTAADVETAMKTITEKPEENISNP